MAYTETESRLRARYTRIRRGLMQQMRRLNAKYPDNTLQQTYRDQFPSLQELGSNISIKGLQLLTKRATGVYRSQVMTLKGYNESLVKSMNTLRELNGFEFVNMENVANVWKFVDEMRARGLADIYGYKYFIGMYNRISKQGMSAGQMEEMVNDWTEYGQRYQQRANRARERGRDIPKPKRLTVPRKRRSGNE